MHVCMYGAAPPWSCGASLASPPPPALDRRLHARGGRRRWWPRPGCNRCCWEAWLDSQEPRVDFSVFRVKPVKPVIHRHTSSMYLGQASVHPSSYPNSIWKIEHVPCLLLKICVISQAPLPVTTRNITFLGLAPFLTSVSTGLVRV